MIALDKIRLIGLLRRSPASAGLLYVRGRYDAAAIGRPVAQRGRRLAVAVGAAIATGLFIGASAWAAAPSTGLYEGHLANGITVALTVTDGLSGPLVTRTGAICQRSITTSSITAAS
jgi:hypothetical protein